MLSYGATSQKHKAADGRLAACLRGTAQFGLRSVAILEEVTYIPRDLLQVENELGGSEWALNMEQYTYEDTRDDRTIRFTP